MIECTFKVLTAQAINEPAHGRKLLSVFVKHFPDHTPQLCGTFEPLRMRFDAARIERTLEAWGSRQNFILQRQEPIAEMQVTFALPSTRRHHSSISCNRLQLSDAGGLSAVQNFVKDVAVLTQADYAMAHVLTRTELDHWLKERLQRSSLPPEAPAEKVVARLRAKAEQEGFADVLWRTEIMTINSLRLQQCLPNLYWFNVFGNPYVELFRREQLMRTPCECIEALDYGGIVMRLTHNLDDSASAWASYRTVRAECRDHLGSDIFCDPAARSTAGSHRTPHFFPERPTPSVPISLQ
jgi:hypothetical protein